MRLDLPKALGPLPFIFFGWTEILFNRVSKQPVIFALFDYGAD